MQVGRGDWGGSDFTVNKDSPVSCVSIRNMPVGDTLRTRARQGYRPALWGWLLVPRFGPGHGLVIGVVIEGIVVNPGEATGDASIRCALRCSTAAQRGSGRQYGYGIVVSLQRCGPLHFLRRRRPFPLLPACSRRPFPRCCYQTEPGISTENSFLRAVGFTSLAGITTGPRVRDGSSTLALPVTVVSPR